MHIKKLKILFISDVYFPRVNGVSTSIRTFVNELQSLGHTVKLIAPDYGIVTDDEHWISRIASRSIYFDPEDKLMRYGLGLAQLEKIKQENYDLIHIHTPFVAHYLGLKLAKKLNIPIVETYHTFFEDYLHHYLPLIPKSMAKWLAQKISKRQCNEVNAIVAPSQPMLDVLRDYGVNAEAAVIATGLNAKQFQLADGLSFRRQHSIPENQSLALYVGRVAHEKNIPFLLNMLIELRNKKPDVLLIIAGEGPAEASLKDQAKKLKLIPNIKFIGYMDRDTMLLQCYQAADVFVFASKSETQGLVLLEAMAQGTPVVAISELGTRSILVEGKGALISAEDEVQFAEKVAILMDNVIDRKRVGDAGREYVISQWSAGKKAQDLISFYQKTCSKNSIL